MIRFIKSLYFTPRFFYLLTAWALAFALSYWLKPLYAWVWLTVLGGVCLILMEIIMLYQKKAFYARRLLPEKFSNGDPNPVNIQVQNKFPFTIYGTVIDELPVQLQKRDFSISFSLTGKNQTTLQYEIRPVERGEYHFGRINVYINTRIGLCRRRFKFDNGQMVKVYPSFIQMKKYDFLAVSNRLLFSGIKKIRRIGHTMEFEQIKEYAPGDDIRTINWKSTAKKADLMVNQYQDEKMQPIYSIIDSSRVMKMPFEGLKLLDYAINSTLAFANIALKKGDKTGMLELGHKIKNYVPAESKKSHLNLLLETLYNLDTHFLDTDFGALQLFVKKHITQRSLLLLYTNFEHITSLQRQLPHLTAIAKKHLLVVVFFENTELRKLIDQPTDSIFEIYDQTIAQQFQYDKKVMVSELQRRGIQTILTTPEELTINTINKYLEIKAKGLL